jgi:hypothetical protein
VKDNADEAQGRAPDAGGWDERHDRSTRGAGTREGTTANEDGSCADEAAGSRVLFFALRERTGACAAGRSEREGQMLASMLKRTKSHRAPTQHVQLPFLIADSSIERSRPRLSSATSMGTTSE